MTQRSSYRPSEHTRHSILKAATNLFADKGYDGTTVRAIVAKARVNQAAINYHFDGKEGLYREVLSAAAAAFVRDDAGSHADEALPREEALRRFVRQQLRPLLARDEISRYIRIFAWESVRPSKVLRDFMASNARIRRSVSRSTNASSITWPISSLRWHCAASAAKPDAPHR